MKKGGLVFLCFFFSIVLYAAPALDDTIHIKKRIQLLQQIEQLQVKEVQTALHGAFPSYRKYYYSSKLKEEDNVFFYCAHFMEPGSV